MHRHHMFMRHRSRGPGLAAKTLPRGFIVGQFRIEHLERHIAL